MLKKVDMIHCCCAAQSTHRWPAAEGRCQWHDKPTTPQQVGLSYTLRVKCIYACDILCSCSGVLIDTLCNACCRWCWHQPKADSRRGPCQHLAAAFIIWAATMDAFFYDLKVLWADYAPCIGPSASCMHSCDSPWATWHFPTRDVQDALIHTANFSLLHHIAEQLQVAPAKGHLQC